MHKLRGSRIRFRLQEYLEVFAVLTASLQLVCISTQIHLLYTLALLSPSHTHSSTLLNFILLVSDASPRCWGASTILSRVIDSSSFLLGYVFISRLVC